MKKKKKCKHDKCKRDANELDNSQGFCDQCIQLNTMLCNFCKLK